MLCGLAIALVNLRDERAGLLLIFLGAAAFIPLLEEGHGTLGTLWLVKDLRKNNVSHYTLRRVEHLRRTVNATLLKLIDARPPSRLPEKP